MYTNHLAAFTQAETAQCSRLHQVRENWQVPVRVF